MNTISNREIFDYLPRNAHLTGTLRYAEDDWEMFIYSMCRLIDIQMDWYHNPNLMRMNKTERWEYVYSLKKNVNSLKKDMCRSIHS